PTQEHANSTQKGRDANPRPSCCEATVLTTQPPCCPHTYILGLTIFPMVISYLINQAEMTVQQQHFYQNCVSSCIFLGYWQAQRNERESIRQKLALGSFYDDEPVIYTSCSKNGLSSWLQSGVNLQVCFVNDSSSDKDSDAEDSRTETSLDTPLSPVSKQSSSLSDRDTAEEDSDPLDDCGGFWRVQRRLQEEARVALALARPMARMQVEVERQIQLHRRSPVADLLPHLPHIIEGLLKRNLRRGDMKDMSLGQLQFITNDLISQIKSLNEELVQLLLMRDELHVEQDARLVDIEDIIRRAHAHSHQRHQAEKAVSK
uniref:Uncharacterized LOC113134636 n=1 Tax=Mastacembelus armatus TaxID=205130 RepID=A0A7N8XNA4_9TELE